MSSMSPHRARRSLHLRAAAAVLSLVVGGVLVSCKAPAKKSSTVDPATSTTSTVVDPGAGPTSITKQLRTTEVANGFDTPTVMVNRPMRNQLWIGERAGRLRVVQLEADWNLETGQTVRGGYKTYPFAVLDISGDVATDGDRGLLGIAFSTDATTLFLDYVNRKGEIVVASWHVVDPVPPPVTVPPADPNAPSTTTTTTTVRPGASTTSTTALRSPIPPPQVDEKSKRVLLTIPHDGRSNYGGQLALGRDGYLYIGVGDATNGSADRSAQDSDSLVGKILRIDPAAATLADPYAVPPSNPFSKGGGAGPVFTLGVQNPLRFSFDRSNGDLWIGDASAARSQEITLLTAATGGGRGANLGWPYTEGTKDPSGDAPSNLVAPLVAFDSSADNCPVIGGYVYRGAAITDLQGVYVYGDRCSGTVTGVLQRRGRVLDRKSLGPQVPTNTLASFGQDDQGELYVLLSSGSLQRLVAA